MNTGGSDPIFSSRWRGNLWKFSSQLVCHNAPLVQQQSRQLPSAFHRENSMAVHEAFELEVSWQVAIVGFHQIMECFRWRTLLASSYSVPEGESPESYHNMTLYGISSVYCSWAVWKVLLGVKTGLLPFDRTFRVLELPGSEWWISFDPEYSSDQNSVYCVSCGFCCWGLGVIPRGGGWMIAGWVWEWRGWKDVVQNIAGVEQESSTSHIPYIRTNTISVWNTVHWMFERFR